VSSDLDVKRLRDQSTEIRGRRLRVVGIERRRLTAVREPQVLRRTVLVCALTKVGERIGDTASRTLRLPQFQLLRRLRVVHRYERRADLGLVEDRH
jgi:hypothetical protein